jgi:PadR family transcriptional regulator, regulatory protein AphA
MLLIGVCVYSYQEEMSTRPLTTSSYAVLGLLAIRPWATYELAKQMRRSLHFFWPRAESNLYAEPKRLVEAGLAEAREEWNGDRKRTVYSITTAGRRSLADWLTRPTAAPRLESEPHLRLLYANYGTREALLATISSLAEDAQTSIDHFERLLVEYARGEGLFPERIHVNTLMATLVLEQARATVRWAYWAADEVARWDDPGTPETGWAVETIRRAVEDDESSSAAP